MMNVTRIDPSRTTTLTRRFMAVLRRYYAHIRRAIIRAIITEDGFGLRNRHDAASLLRNDGRWEFMTDPEKVAAFNLWLQGLLNDEILTASDVLGRIDRYGNFMTDYVISAYRQGVVRAYTDTRRGAGDFYEGGKAEFLRQAFDTPEAVSKMRLLATRAFEDLKGINASMSAQIGRILADGIAAGRPPRELAAEIVGRVEGIGVNRAMMLARTEIMHAHAEGQLDSFELLGLDEITIMAEWSTAGDDAVCEKCEPLEGVVMTIREARGLIPRHPNCRCVWLPANVGETGRGQRWTGRGPALAASVAAETGGRRESRWAGAGKRLSRILDKRASL